MTCAISPDTAAANYRAALSAFFGTKAPETRRQESGSYSVLFYDGGILRPKTFTASELVRITKFYQREN